MSEIIKLYENAEVEKPQINYCKSDNCPFNWKYGICQTKKCPNWTTEQSKCYPPFTAEKQIELIKWLIQKDFSDERIIQSNFEKTYYYCSFNQEHRKTFTKFEEALAYIFNYLWQSLAEEEKQQIKEILNEKL